MAVTYPDVSQWRKGLSLAGAAAVCAKVTEWTDFYDPEYANFKAKAAREPCFFFAFHFLRKGNPAGQAKWCHDHAGGTPLMLDVERRLDPAHGIDSKPTLADATGFIDAYRKLGGVCWLVYLPHWYWQDFMGSASLQPLEARGMLLVSSNYSGHSTGAGWVPYGGMTPVIWQYTDSQSFNGQAVDFNEYKGTLADLAALAATGKVAGSMAAKQLTESKGWVNGVTHHNSPNQNSGMAVPSGVTGVVMHTMVGNLPGTDSAFMQSSFQASAHFGVGQDGSIIQWVNIRGGVAWHCAAGNAHWYGIEHADNGNPNNPLSDAQLTASAQLVELLSRNTVGRFTLGVAPDISHEGYACHYMGGAAWGGHTCPDSNPGAGPRSKQRAEVIRRAQIIRQTGQYPAPGGGSSQEDDMSQPVHLPDAGTVPLSLGSEVVSLWFTGTVTETVKVDFLGVSDQSVEVPVGYDTANANKGHVAVNAACRGLRIVRDVKNELGPWRDAENARRAGMQQAPVMYPALSVTLSSQKGG